METALIAIIGGPLSAAIVVGVIVILTVSIKDGFRNAKRRISRGD